VAYKISVKVCKGKILVICVNLDNVTKKNSAIFLESFNNGQEFQFNNRVVGLSIGKFVNVKCQRSSVLLNY
jgi:hypothetical protein